MLHYCLTHIYQWSLVTILKGLFSLTKSMNYPPGQPHNIRLVGGLTPGTPAGQLIERATVLVRALQPLQCLHVPILVIAVCLVAVIYQCCAIHLHNGTGLQYFEVTSCNKPHSHTLYFTLSNFGADSRTNTRNVNSHTNFCFSAHEGLKAIMLSRVQFVQWPTATYTVKGLKTKNVNMTKRGCSVICLILVKFHWTIVLVEIVHFYQLQYNV